MLLILGTATYGFAAGNTVPDGYAGEGQGAISGYEVYNVKYTLNSGNPLLFASVEFDLRDQGTLATVAASDVYAGIDTGSTTWFHCDDTTSTTHEYYCPVTSAITSAVILHVSSVE
jgi:hypothetical protein